MRNRITIIAVFLITFNGYSQDYSGSQIGNPNILPPDVSSFQKVNFLPVSNYTGRANIDIPFYNINLGGLNIPISLSYNTSGVKPNDVASSVGMNWSLNAGGLISKNTKGIDDFYNDAMHQIGDPASGLDDIYWEKRIGFLSYDSNHISNSSFHHTDDLPDTFNVNAPGLNFSFIHNRGKLSDGLPYTPDLPFTLNAISGANQNNQFVNLIDNTSPWDTSPFILNGSNDYKIDEIYENIKMGMFGIENSSFGGGFYSRFWLDNNGSYNSNYSRFGINSIIIKDLNGFEYIFDKIDTSQYVLNRNINENFTLTYENYLGTQSVNLSTNVNLVAYHLSKITDKKTNKFVKFEYETYSQNFSEIIDNNVINIHYDGPFPKPKGLWQKFPKLNRLKKIIFDKGYIEFNYGLDRLDVLGEKALTSIILKDNDNNQIKKAVLNFDYFQSLNQQESPFSKRLKLENIIFEGKNNSLTEKYKLTYNSTPLPLRILAVTDLFGYNNGYADNFQFNIVNNQFLLQSVIPSASMYFHPNKGQNSFLPVAINVNAIPISGNYSLEPNLEFCKSGILERIDYPTGGFTNLQYELNNFQIDNFQLFGGGLRVKEQNISDGINIKTLKFEYLKSDGTSSGTVASIPKFVDFDYNVFITAPLLSTLPNSITLTQFNSWFSIIKNNFPKNNVELTNGSYVGYSRVKVYEEGEGFTLYDYTAPSTFPNNESSLIWGISNDSNYTSFSTLGKVLYDNGKMDLHFDNDLFRGKILNEFVYNQQNVLLKETKYEYTEKLFKSMLTIKELNSIYQNYSWTPESPFSMPPTPPYQYGYFKQRRFMLTDIIENEYFNGQLVTKSKRIEYDDNLSLIKKEFQNDNLNTFRNEYYYPHDIVNQNEVNIPHLIAVNRKGEKILSYTFRNNEKISESKILYKNFNGIILPKQIKKYKSSSINNSNEINSLEVTLRDNLGNVCEVMDTNGSKTSYIWGYKQTLIIAKIENASYSSIPLSLLVSVQTSSDSGTESQLVDNLSTLRQAMNSSFTTCYTYIPLIGVSKIIDPKGDVLTYQYDALGRLNAVKDKYNNILTENEYHYKNQN